MFWASGHRSEGACGGLAELTSRDAFAAMNPPEDMDLPYAGSCWSPGGPPAQRQATRIIMTTIRPMKARRSLGPRRRVARRAPA